MAQNRFVDAVKDSIQTNKTGNRYVDAAVSGQKVSSSAPTVRSSVAAAYTQRRQDEQKQEQERKRAAQNKVQMQKLGKQTNRQRFDTGENESQLGYGNYLSYKGVDQREIPWKQMTQRSIDAAKQTAAEAQAAKRGGGSRGGGLRSDGTRYEPKPSIGKTVLNAANRGAGEGFVVPMYETADFLANLIPNAVAGIKGAEDPESTFTGQLFKPVTDATQKALDYVKGETGASAAIVQEATKGNRTAQLAADIGAGVVGAIPNAALAMMTGGASLGGEIGAALTPQAAGMSGTALNAVQKVVNNPSFQLSYLQTLGGAYQDAKEAGASEANAAAAAFISAAANALVEAGGGLETLPGDLKAKDLSTFEKAREWLTSALDEGKEEVIQGVISTLTNKAAANSDNPYFSMTDENAVINPARMGKEFGMGTAVGGVLGGAQMFGTEAANRIANRHAGPNANIDSEITPEVTDPMEFAVRETMKPSKERQAMDQAIEDTANWMLGKEKTAAAEAETESTRVKPKVGMDDFTNRQSEVFNNLEYGDTGTATKIMQQTHADMLQDGTIVRIPEETANQTQNYYPDLRDMKKKDRTPILKQKMSELKADLRKFLSGMKGVTYEFDVNGNVLDARLYDAGIREVMEKVTQDKASMLRHSDEIFQNARYLYSTPDYEGNPNIYRWNYFYTPVQIGDNTLGVRIAVRDVVAGQNGSPESQIYNWGIKKDATLDGGKLGNRAASPNVSSDASTNNTIPNSNQNVNQKKETNFDNDMGHGAVGAAEVGFNPYSNYQNRTDAADFMPEGANAARPVDMPKVDPTGRQVRSGAKTIYGAEATTDARATQMENEYMEGLYGYDPVRDKPTLEKAKANLKEEGYDRAYARVAEKLAAVKDMKQTAMEAFLLYSDAVQSGRDGDAANLCLLLSESGTEFGQGVQVFSMFRKLSPEGQLYALQKSVERLNNKMNPETSQSVTIKQEALREIVKQRDAALQMLEDLNARDHGVPVEDWMQEVGKQLAKAIGAMPTPPKPKTVAQTVRSDLLRFAKDYFPKKSSGAKRTAVDTLRDFFSNRDQYVEAWNTARKAYREAHKWDGDADFADATITYNGLGTDPVMTQAIVDEAVSQELNKKGVNIKSKLGDRGVLENQIADSLIKQTDASGADASMIQDAVTRYFNENYRYDQNKAEADIQSDIAKVVKEMGQTAAEIIRSSKQSKTKTAREIANELVSQYGISKKNAKTAANMIVDQFNQYVAERSENTLRNMFEQREGKKKGKRTFEDRFDELVNLGAFTSENWASAVNEKMFGPGVTLTPELVQQYIDAPNQQVRDTVMDEIYQNIGSQVPTTAKDAADQWRYMSMLLNPSTHLKNMGGNISMMMLKGSKDVVGTGIEVTLNGLTKGKTGRTKAILNPLSAKDRSLMGTAWADFHNVRDDVAGIGKNSDNLMGKVGEYRNMWKLNDPKTKAGQVVDKALRTAEKVPQGNTKLMDLEDQLFSQPDYALSLAGYMKANHQTEITPEARAYAIKEAQKATFRDANAVSTFARNMGHSNSKLWNGIVNAVFPFKGTPANVGVRAVEYSPLGFVNTVAQAIKAKNNGTFKATDFIDNISANLVGSALSVFGYWLASNGWLRVAGVGDDKEKEEQEENGYKDNSFKLFGYSVPENCFTSVSAPMFIGAAAYEALASKALTGEAYTLDDYIEALSTTVDPLLEQTMLTGLDDVLTTARYNQGGVGDTVGEMGLQVAGSWLSSYIPTLISRISAAKDGTQRQVYIDKNKPLQGVQRQVQNLMMKTPLREHLNERVDRYGNVQTQEGIFDTGNEKLDNVLNFGYNVVTPSYASKIQESPTSDELSRLYRSPDVDNSERKLFQNDAPKSIQVNGVTKNLTGEQYENYEKIRGNNTTEYLGALQADSQYDSLGDEMQGYATDKMYDYIEQTSKAELGIGYEPTDDWIADLQGKSDAEIVETILYKTFEAAANSKEYDNKYEGMADLVDRDKLSDAMAITMMPDSMQTAYTDIAKKGGVSVDEWLDMYAYAYPAGKTDKGTQDKGKVRDAALDYINRQRWSDSKKLAAANATYDYLPNTIMTDASLPYDWTLNLGDSGLAYVENSMSDGQKEDYDKYVKGHLDNDKMKLYLDAYKFKGKARSDYEEDGKTVKYAAKSKVIDYIDSLSGLTNQEKIRIFLGIGYSDKSIPYWWY